MASNFNWLSGVSHNVRGCPRASAVDRLSSSITKKLLNRDGDFFEMPGRQNGVAGSQTPEEITGAGQHWLAVQRTRTRRRGAAGESAAVVAGRRPSTSFSFPVTAEGKPTRVRSHDAHGSSASALLPWQIVRLSGRSQVIERLVGAGSRHLASNSTRDAVDGNHSSLPVLREVDCKSVGV